MEYRKLLKPEEKPVLVLLNWLHS